ncbi:MAG TPA: Ig-like domain-containing protein, partial [Gemmatimonadaceae bacterium]|nr:Ig-like domain-containing protein [Gemmatimonadaceae bacterium]
RRVAGRFAPLFLAGLLACDDVDVTCVGTDPAVSIVPQQLTLAVGQSGELTASVPASWTFCGRTATYRNAVTWTSSNTAVVTITPIDATHARVTAVGRGQTTVIARAVDDESVAGAAAVVVP